MRESHRSGGDVVPDAPAPYIEVRRFPLVSPDSACLAAVDTRCGRVLMQIILPASKVTEKHERWLLEAAEEMEATKPDLRLA